MGLEALEVSPPTSDNADTPAKYWKTQDPYIFKPAEWFFKEIAGGKPKQPHTISCEEADQQANGTPLPTSSHGRIFRFNDKLGFLLIQFMRPQVWRIRFHSTNTTPSDFSDYNTRTIVQDTLTKTIEILDLAEDLSWHVELVQPNDEYYILQSVLGSESVHDQSRKVIVQRRPSSSTTWPATICGWMPNVPSIPYKVSNTIRPWLRLIRAGLCTGSSSARSD